MIKAPISLRNRGFGILSYIRWGISLFFKLLWIEGVGGDEVYAHVD